MQECDHCSVCCRNPGMMTPIDVERISAHLKLSEREFVRKFCILITMQDDERLFFALLPVKSGNNGRMEERIVTLKYNLERNYCIFWKDYGCSINEVKPLGCKSYNCWKMTGGNDEILDIAAIKDEWKDYQSRLRKLFPELKKESDMDLKEVLEAFKVDQQQLSIRPIEKK